MTLLTRFLLSSMLAVPVASSAAPAQIEPVAQPASQLFNVDSTAAAATAVPTVVEFYNPDLKHYFITADPGEQTFVDSGAVGRWQRTGYAFQTGGASKVCRFFGNALPNPATGVIYGPNSHFYTVDVNECASLVSIYNPNAKSWKFESNDFSISMVANGACSGGLLPVYRLYNNGFAQGLDSNHRFVTSTAVYNQMIAQGWSGEGIAMCASAELSTVATVFAVTPDALMYNKTARFTVTGQNLDRGVTLVAPACANIVEAAGGTAAQRVFTCVPSSTGALPLSVKLSDGSTAASISPQVPLPQVTMTTTVGQIVIELYPNNTPITVKNFLQYVSDGFYKDKIFHRVISNFVIQGGGYNSQLIGAATRPPIALEAQKGLSNLRGSIAMARTAVLDSATSQFFFNVVDNGFLDSAGGGYAVFGKVVKGMEVVDQIKGVATQNYNGFADVPVTPILITAATQSQ